MGLDMYAHAVRKAPGKPVDFEVENDDIIGGELAYWRKHPNLHGWMERLYREKGGSAKSFNCVNVQLTAEDLDLLEADVRGGDLPDTSGFFFGQSDGCEVNEDLAFIGKAREQIALGRAVFYTSWW